MENCEKYDKQNEEIRIDISQPDKSDIVRDEAWLMCTVIKWCAIAIITGAVVGIAAGGFLIALRTAISFVGSFGKMKLLFIFPGLAVSCLLISVFAPQSAGHGTEAVIDAFHNKSGTPIDFKAVPTKLIATIITIACGGSLGIEGPCAQIGSGVAYVAGRAARLDEADMKKIVICGIAAGFCAVFGTPVAGAIFAVEVLFVGQMFYDVLLPALISGTVGYFTAAAMGAVHMSHYTVSVPALSPYSFIFALGAGAFFGCIAIADIEGIHAAKSIFKRFGITAWRRPIAGTVALTIIGVVFGYDYLSLGSNVIHDMITGAKSLPFGFILKIAAMGITIAAGGCGGEITPTLFIGASSGMLFSMIFGADVSFGSALGVAAVLAAATNTPIAGTVLAMEFFGSQIAPFAGVACVVAYLLAGHRSLYPTQVMMSPKSRIFVIKKTARGEKLVRRFDSISLKRIIHFYAEQIITKVIKRK